jgi:hypothetical protein
MSRSNQPDLPIEDTFPLKPSPPQERGQEVSRPIMAFVAGSRPQFADETAALLRSRLQAATLVLSILLAVAFIGNLFSDYAPLTLVCVTILAGFVGSYFVLRGSRPFSLPQLRYFEAGIFAALVVQVLLMMGTRLVEFAKVGDTVSFVAAEHTYLSGWAILIFTYGILSDCKTITYSTLPWSDGVVPIAVEFVAC